MRFLISSLALMAVFSFATSMPSPHKGHHDKDHGKATSYSIITRHESKHNDHHDGGHDHEHKEHHHEHHHGHHVDYHHGHKVEHGHDDHHSHHHHKDEHHSHPKYNFKYGVKDTKTGDIKEQWESRDGDKVEGGYTLKEADGTTRLVKYTSDKKTGFEATVHKIGHPKHEEHKQDHHDQTYHSHGIAKHLYLV